MKAVRKMGSWEEVGEENVLLVDGGEGAVQWCFFGVDW
jgi:hypothetical protein